MACRRLLLTLGAAALPHGCQAATPPAAPAAGGKVRAKALYDYAPQNADELELHADDIIEVHNKQEDGWWEGSTRGKRGVFPANYVEEVA